jgi:hypothetical protein
MGRGGGNPGDTAKLKIQFKGPAASVDDRTPTQETGLFSESAGCNEVFWL